MGITIEFKTKNAAKTFESEMSRRGYATETYRNSWATDSAEWTEVASNVVAEVLSARDCSAKVH